jgi:hypothetical protein
MTKTWLAVVFVGLPVGVAACAQLIGIEDLPPLPDTGDAGLGDAIDSDGDGIADDREQQDLNYDGAKLIYRPIGTGALELFDEVPDASMCGTAANAFYRTGAANAPTFELCPATCDRVEVDLLGKINLLIDCAM